MGTFHTIGHSTHDPDDFLALLRAAGIRLLADVRRYPGSRRLPHFSERSLRIAMHRDGREYLNLPELGGRRRPLPESPNGAWENEGFRGYADHMASKEFASGVARLEAAEAGGAHVAVMCAEGPWWRCHRRLLADALLARGHDVIHVMPDGRQVCHEPREFAVFDGDRVSYPPAQTTLGL